MKVLIVSTSDLGGGAARAAYRLQKALVEKGIDSKMLVQQKLSDDHNVFTLNKKKHQYINFFRPFIDSLLVRFYKNREKSTFSPAWINSSSYVNLINYLKPDIVHLHWVNSGMLKIEDIPKINSKIIWTLHDNWAYTGGCHVKLKCEKYKNKCQSCPILKSKNKYDLSSWIWNRKYRTFKKIDIIFIALSRWIMNDAMSSPILNKHRFVNIHNPLNLDVFRPINKKFARNLWNLPLDKKLILFGANNATNDPNKGFFLLKEALSKIELINVELIVFGSSKPKISQNFGFKTHYLGKLSDDLSLVTIYNAADVMVVPSLQETLPQTACESIACGTPVVAFGHTGLLDIIDHKSNGYLADPFNTNDLKNGIEWVLTNEDYDLLSFNARSKAIESFDSELISKKIIEIYREILYNKNN